MKRIVMLILLFGLFLSVVHGQHLAVRTGIDVLIKNHWNILKGKRVGLITNPTGVSQKLESTVDLLAHAPEVSLVALFGPEHGVRGDVAAGGKISTFTDPATGLPVYSLYGKTRKPTPEILKNIDVLVYDIQDIGARSYTFINTMALAMEAAAEQNIEFIVLDRPDPLTGTRVEGNILDEKFKSFVGQYPIPYVYGMTCGELATMINEEGWLAGKVRCKLSVVKLEGWDRSMLWDDTGLQWIPTSPHIPNAQTALMYCATGILGELDTINIGVGYTMPFQLVGAPWIDAEQFAEALNAKKLPGIFFRPLSFKPFYGVFQGIALQGVQIHLVDKKAANLTNVQLHIIEVLNTLYPVKNIFRIADSSRIKMFDKVMGTNAVREAFLRGTPAEEIIRTWKKDVEVFLSVRKKYLLYQ